MTVESRLSRLENRPTDPIQALLRSIKIPSPEDRRRSYQDLVKRLAAGKCLPNFGDYVMVLLWNNKMIEDLQADVRELVASKCEQAACNGRNLSSLSESSERELAKLDGTY